MMKLHDWKDSEITSVITYTKISALVFASKIKCRKYETRYVASVKL